MLDGVITFCRRIDFTAPLSCYIEGRFTGIKAN